MDLEQWFAPAMELGKLVCLYRTAEQDQREAIAKQIEECPHIARLRAIQSNSSTDFLRANLYNPVNSIRRDYFVNPAVCAFTEDRSGCYPTSYHHHDYFELIFVLRGSYDQVINGSKHHFSQGEVCMLNPRVVHRDEIPGPNDRVIYMGLSSSFLEGELMHFFEPHPDLAGFLKTRNESSDVQYIRFLARNFSAVENMLEKIVEEDEEKLAGHHLVIKGYLVRMFKLLVDGGQYSLCVQSEKEIDQTLCREILDYMYSHLTDISRTEVAEYFHFNPDYLNRFLIRCCGENYSTLLTRMRMEKAAYELRNTDLSVAKIISNLGFSNRGHFNRLFTEKYGMLPGEYRKE